MNQFRKIERVYPPPSAHWVGNGFKVNNFFPRAIQSYTRMSPFFLLDYNSKMYYPPSNEKRGVGVHPHRGLETVTIAYKGKVAHHDSVGNAGVISEGDVQWMTAGKAILHKEFQEQTYVEKGGDFQMVQLWVNLPAKHKMTEPKYQEIPNNKLEKIFLPNNQGTLNIISGEYNAHKGPAETFTQVNLFDLRLNENSNLNLTLNKLHNTSFLIIEGKVKINKDYEVATDNLVLFENSDAETINIESSSGAVVLIMSGEPIDEEVCSGGPFLMNTKEEINQAWEDYRNGYFGYLSD